MIGSHDLDLIRNLIKRGLQVLRLPDNAVVNTCVYVLGRLFGI